jgi:hypothetical protein
MGVDNIEQTENTDPSKLNKFTGEKHNRVQINISRQMDLEELIKIMEEEEHGKESVQGDKA